MHCCSFLLNRTSTSAGEGIPPGHQNLNCTDFSEDVGSRTMAGKSGAPRDWLVHHSPAVSRRTAAARCGNGRMAPWFAPAVRSFRSCPRVWATAATAYRESSYPEGRWADFAVGLSNPDFANGEITTADARKPWRVKSPSGSWGI